MVDEKLLARDAAKAIVAVEEIGSAAVVIENARSARQRLDAPAALLAIEAVAARRRGSARRGLRSEPVRRGMKRF